MIRRYKGRLWHMHIHNSRPSEKWKDHYGDLDGPIDIARVIRTLNEVGYDGMMVLELHRQNETMEQKARFGWYVSELLEK